MTDQRSFSMAINLSILMFISLDNVWILLRKLIFVIILGLKGLNSIHDQKIICYTQKPIF